VDEPVDPPASSPDEFPKEYQDLPTLRGSSPELWKRIVPRLIFMAIMGVTLYILWPSLVSVFRSWPDLLRVKPYWYPIMLACEFASFGCAWGLQAIALRTTRWFAVATAQLAGNAVSKIVPGGAASGGAIQFRMLSNSGIRGARVGSGLAAAGLISTATLFALPVLSVPAVLLGRPTPNDLAEAAWLGGVVFVIAFVFGWVMLTREEALRGTGRAIQWTRNHILRKRAPLTNLPDTLVRERDAIQETLERAWWKALLFSLGNWLFDYLALLAALAAVGSKARPTLVLLAYAASMVLTMIPITPGGLGFVEAGLASLLVVAGASPAQAAVGTLAYRLVSYWLPLPAGAIAAALHRRRYPSHPPPASEAPPTRA
jgi:uncharacterized protein (TIRG00374 family)